MGPSERFCRWFVRKRHAFALAIAATTILLAAQIRDLEVFTQFADLLIAKPTERPTRLWLPWFPTQGTSISATFSKLSMA
jgi:hypothetical protein